MFRDRAAKLGIVATLLAGLAASARGDSLDGALRDEAPRVMDYLKGHGYHAVGVLKFSVKKGAQAESLHAGPLNAMMATRLEHALIQLVDPARPIEILHDPSRVAAAQAKGASTRAEAGRRKLFGHEYPVAWGGQSRKPDAFLTGEVIVDRDMKKCTLVVQAFDAARPDELAEVARVKGVPTDRSLLASIGQSFAVPRRLGHANARALDEAAAADASDRDKGGDPPIDIATKGGASTQDGDDPVKLEIDYDGSPVVLEPDSGSPGEVRVKASKAADPKEGQKVKFVLTNTSRDTVGVVLAVNGKNTLFLEDLATRPPGSCTKWILAPGEVYTVAGFYAGEDGKEVRGFKVLSDEESARSDLAPEQKGVYSMYVFRQVANDSATAQNISADGADLARSPKPHSGPRSLAELQAAIHAASHTKAVGGRLVAEHPTRSAGSPARHARQQKGGRGLVVEDSETSSGGALHRLESTFDPQPAMAVSIRYYAGPTPTNP